MQTRSSPSLARLHSLARQACIPEYRKMSKYELYKTLQERINIDRILRTETRNEFGSSCSFRGKRHRQEEMNHVCNDRSNTELKKPKLSSTTSKRDTAYIINKMDPIMFEPIKANAFIFVRPNGSRVAFNVDTLIDYMMLTGDFNDPETRLPFSESDLKNIDKLALKLGYRKKSVFEAKQSIGLFSDMKFKRDALLGLERCAGEVINEIMGIIEKSDEDAELQLLLHVFPNFADLFRQIREGDEEYAKQCMSHWKSFIKGPPNKPTRDYYGLQPIILQFLESCARQ
jgi:hypothetical protein